MKISFFTSWDTKCGIADYSCYFKNALEKQGLTINIVPVSENSKTFDFIKLGKLMNTANIAHIQHEYSFFGKNNFLWAINFYFFLTQIKIPKVLTLHEIMLPARGKPFFRLRRYIIYLAHRVIFSKIDVIIVHLNSHREDLLSMGVSTEKLVVMPLPVPEFRPLLLNTEECKSLLGVTGKRVLTIFGFVVKKKGYELVLPAIKELRNCILCIAGGPPLKDAGNYLQELKMEIIKLNIKDKVKILGFLPEYEVNKIMCATDIILAPFLQASGSASLSTAIAYHKPIIASNIRALRELSDMGLAMEMFDSGNSDDLKEKIVYLTNNPERMDQLAEMTKQYAEKYSYTNAAGNMYKIYQSLSASSRKS